MGALSNSEFVAFVAEQMAFIDGLRMCAMFGGQGVYRDDDIFAIIVDDSLYFKTDKVSRAEFEARGLAPFCYQARGKLVAMQYFQAPPEVFEETESMRYWAQLACAAALRAKKTHAGTPPSRPR